MCGQTPGQDTHVTHSLSNCLCHPGVATPSPPTLLLPAIPLGAVVAGRSGCRRVLPLHTQCAPPHRTICPGCPPIGIQEAWSKPTCLDVQKGSTSIEVLASVSLYFASVQWVPRVAGKPEVCPGPWYTAQEMGDKGHVPAFLEDCSLKEVGGISGDTRKNTAEQISGRSSLCAGKNNSIHHPGACGDMGLREAKEGPRA